MWNQSLSPSRNRQWFFPHYYTPSFLTVSLETLWQPRWVPLAHGPRARHNKSCFQRLEVEDHIFRKGMVFSFELSTLSHLFSPLLSISGDIYHSIPPRHNRFYHRSPPVEAYICQRRCLSSEFPAVSSVHVHLSRQI